MTGNTVSSDDGPPVDHSGKAGTRNPAAAGGANPLDVSIRNRVGTAESVDPDRKDSESPKRSEWRPTDANYFGLLYVIAVVVGLVPVFAAPRGMWPVPIAVLVAYLAFGYSPAKRSRTVFEFADSVYYLGFTLSVGSLLASLEPFQIGKQPDPREVFHLFGLGMLTTLAGVVARTALQTFHRTPSESIEDVNERIAVEAAQFTERLISLNGQLSAALSTAANSMEQNIAPSLHSVASTLGETDKALKQINSKAAQLEIVLSEHLTTAEQNTARFGKAAKDVEGTAKLLADSFKTVSDGAVPLAALSSSLQSLQQPVADAKKAIGEFATAVTTVEIDTTAIDNAVQHGAGKIQKRVGEASSTLEDFTKLAAQVRLELEAVVGLSSEITAGSLTAPLKQLTEASTTLSGLAKTTNERTINEIDQFVKDAEALGVAAGKVSKALEEITDVALKRLEELDPTISG